MSDGSYVQVSQATYPGKVFWGRESNGDHSAVTTSQQGILISKWNEWPLMQHAWNYSPFGTSNLKYYVKAPIITGPSSVCPGTTGVFTVNHPFANVGVTWSCSPSLSITPNGNSVTVTNNTTLNNSPTLSAPSMIPPGAIVNYASEGWVQAVLASTGDTLKRTITVNKHTVENFNLPATASANTLLIVTATTAAPDIVEWSVTPSTGVDWQQWLGNSIQIAFSQAGFPVSVIG